MATDKTEFKNIEIKPDPDKWIAVLDQMIESGDYIFAEDFLTDVREYAETNNVITNNQTKAILKIRRSTQ